MRQKQRVLRADRKAIDRRRVRDAKAAGKVNRAVVDPEAAKVAEDRVVEIAEIVRKGVAARKADAAIGAMTGVAAIAIAAVSKARRKSISKN